jgi:hypothetical protein
MHSLDTPLLILAVLRNPNLISNFSELQWDLLIRQARTAGLLARIGLILLSKGLRTEVPEKAWRHIDSDIQLAEALKRNMCWEVARISDAINPLGVKLILLKGAAYTLSGVSASLGRLYRDTDIIVSQAKLDDVERMLMWYGWIDGEQDEYDQKYYRQWMHELPPKYHKHRGTTLDIHHNIIPKTCALCPEAEWLLVSAVNIPGSNYWTLAPEDMILHSASHLFWGGEFENGLRDLSDIDLLLREFCDSDSGFWQRLLARADHLSLGKPLFYALRYSHKLLETPVSDVVLNTSNVHAPSFAQLKIMDSLFMRALYPSHPSCDDPFTGLARWVLYLRSHWLKMTLRLLIPHLTRKAWLRLNGKGQH